MTSGEEHPDESRSGLRQPRICAIRSRHEGSAVLDRRRCLSVDAVIGQNPAPAEQEWPTGRGRKFTMGHFVTRLGGEDYFCANPAVSC